MRHAWEQCLMCADFYVFVVLMETLSFVSAAVPFPVTARPVLHPSTVHPSPGPEASKPAHQRDGRTQTG